MSKSPEFCPYCGAEVPPDAKVCKECGSDEETGWSEQARYDSLDLPDENFEYSEFVRREFSDGRPAPTGLHWFWWLIGLLLLAAIALAIVL